jgi:sugar phosphate isomerase/epimerase
MQINRREMLAAGAMALGCATVMETMTMTAHAASRSGFRFCLNTSTIQGQKLTLEEEVEIAAKAGYHAIEPWINEIERYVESGKSLSDLRKRIHDHGMTVEDGIGFAEWIVDDDARRAKGLETARRDMDLLSQLGCPHMAAPASGATDVANLDLRKAAERYLALAQIGDNFGVAPMVEVWGFSKCLTRLGEASLVAIESGHPKACILPDVYHLYKGGSPVNGIKLLSRDAIHVFHLNDYPATPPPATITDADRVYPGDGIAPLTEVFKILREIGYDGVLSIELFNHSYWKEDALKVAKTALEKSRAAEQAG